MLRKVKVFKQEQNMATGVYTKQEKGIARFHAYGIDYVENRIGIAHYTTAIIEYPNGKVGNVSLDSIQFIT